MAIALGCLTGIMIGLFVYIKIIEKRTARRLNANIAENSIPTYEDATKDDPPRYGQLEEIPPPAYIVQTSETALGPL